MIPSMGEEDPSVTEKMYQAQSKIIQKLADMGPCVIIGRCADYILKDRDDVLSVFISAEEEERVQRMMERRELTHERAVNKIEFSDRDRAKYYNFCTKQKWGVPDTYDVTLSSTKLGIDGVVDMLVKIYNA